MNVASVLQDCLLICSPFKLSCYLGMKSLPPSGFGKHCANLKVCSLLRNHANVGAGVELCSLERDGQKGDSALKQRSFAAIKGCN